MGATGNKKYADLLTANDLTPQHALGERIEDDHGFIWVYSQMIGGAAAAGQGVFVTDYSIPTVQTALAGSQGAHAGMVPCIVTQNYYCWVLVKGYSTLPLVDGTTDVALGDALSLHATSGAYVQAAATTPRDAKAGAARAANSAAATAAWINGSL